jgi:hypothetical protein
VGPKGFDPWLNPARFDADPPLNEGAGNRNGRRKTPKQVANQMTHRMSHTFDCGGIAKSVPYLTTSKKEIGPIELGASYLPEHDMGNMNVAEPVPASPSR